MADVYATIFAANLSSFELTEVTVYDDIGITHTAMSPLDRRKPRFSEGYDICWNA
jgi:hypothetical protein